MGRQQQRSQIGGMGGIGMGSQMGGIGGAWAWEFEQWMDECASMPLGISHHVWAVRGCGECAGIIGEECHAKTVPVYGVRITG